MFSEPSRRDRRAFARKRGVPFERIEQAPSWVVIPAEKLGYPPTRVRTNAELGPALVRRCNAFLLGSRIYRPAGRV